MMTDPPPPPGLSPEDLSIAPLERAETIPSSWYTDPRFFEFEKGSVFARTWQFAGHIGRLGEQGDYLAGSAAGNPILLVRGKDNLLRAFYNVCRHRGGPIAIDESGNCNALQCKYHGWTYTLEGMLRGVPQFDRVELFDRKEYGLIPVKLDGWQGLQFVKISGGEDPGLQSILEPVGNRIAPIDLVTKKFYRRVEYRLNCNWKVYVDNYLEGYHLPYVHPELCNLLDYQQYVTETFGQVSLQYSPLNRDQIYGSMGQSSEAFYYFIFPNTMLNILPGRLQTNVVTPLAHDKTKVTFEYYYDDITSADAIRAIGQDIGYSERVQQEDIEICERVQAGLNSVAYDRGRFSVEMERGVFHFQCLLKDAYRKFMNR
jgi:phenylpropionate dioxygenase-like ring-hydroxylating dioxygenase large terminal subunit